MSHTPEAGEAKVRPAPPIAELLAVANAKLSANPSADDFITEHSVQDLLGRVIDSQGLNIELMHGNYTTPNSEVTVRLDYDWMYNLTSEQEDGDNEGTGYAIYAEHSIYVDGKRIEYSYAVTIPDDYRLVCEAGHSWKVVDGTGAPIDGPEFTPEQTESSGSDNDQLFIALLQRSCEDLALVLQAKPD